MKKSILLTIAFATLLSGTAFAETKVGVFNMAAVIVGSDYGQAMNAELKAKFEPLAKQLQRDAEEIKRIESELRTQDMALKLDAKQEKQREYRRKARDYQDSAAAYRQKRQSEGQKLQQPIMQRLQQVVSEYGKANGYTVILESSTTGVAFAADGVNITDALIAELNKMKKAGK